MKTSRQKLLRRFLIEIALYGLLVVVYLFVVIQGLRGFLTQLSSADPILYAVTALLLILAQGWLLESVTSFLLERLGLE